MALVMSFSVSQSRRTFFRRGIFVRVERADLKPGIERAMSSASFENEHTSKSVAKLLNDPEFRKNDCWPTFANPVNPSANEAKAMDSSGRADFLATAVVDFKCTVSCLPKVFRLFRAPRVWYRSSSANSISVGGSNPLQHVPKRDPKRLSSGNWLSRSLVELFALSAMVMMMSK